MAFPVGAYVASHLAAQRMRKQNNKSTSSESLYETKPVVPFWHKQFISRSSKLVNYTPHEIHTKYCGTKVLYHTYHSNLYHNGNEHGDFVKFRKDLKKEFTQEILSVYLPVSLGLLLSVGIVIFSIVTLS